MVARNGVTGSGGSTSNLPPRQFFGPDGRSAPIWAIYRPVFVHRLQFGSGTSVLALSALLLFFSFSNLALGEGPRGFDTVVVDAGHGGYDPGGILGVRTNPNEKTVTLAVARRLARILQSEGFRVVMTRDADVFVSLGQRAAPTYYFRGRAVFVSIHFNAALRVGARGIETYYYRPDSLGLAARVHRAILAATGADDRYVHWRGFFVIRRSAVPAILCECGFLTNPDESRLAARADYQQRLATAIAAGLLTQRQEGNPPGVQVPVYQPPVSDVYRPFTRHRAVYRQHIRSRRAYRYRQTRTRASSSHRHRHRH
jgi:N-acetylmuramoyl-L-alanine amidase